MSQRAWHGGQAMVEMLVVAMAIIGIILGVTGLIQDAAHNLMADSEGWVELAVTEPNATANPLFDGL